MFKQRNTWRNWARNLSATGFQWVQPKSTQEVCDAVIRARKAGQRLRVVGASHSFSPVAAPQELLMSLSHLRGVLAFDPQAQEVTVAAGTPLSELGPALMQQGWALANMGDVHAQSIAGAVCTGTHGTGIDLPSISASVVGWEFVNGQGELVKHRRGDDDLSLALHLSLGLLGVFVAFTLKVVPLYGLLERSESMDFESGLAQFLERTHDVRHLEWFLFPGSNRLQQKTLELVEPAPLSLRQKFSDQIESKVLLNGLFYLVSEWGRRFPSYIPKISRLAAAGIPNTTRQGYSYEVFPKPRGVRFVECEYFVKLSDYKEVLTRCNEELLQDTKDSHFPIEVRVQPGESGFLSPTQGEPSLVLSFHVYKGIPYERMFAWAKELMKSYEGRPHWGKVSLLSHQETRALFPQLDRFLAVRERCDPDRVFVTPYFAQRLLGEQV